MMNKEHKKNLLQHSREQLEKLFLNENCIFSLSVSALVTGLLILSLSSCSLWSNHETNRKMEKTYSLDTPIKIAEQAQQYKIDGFTRLNNAIIRFIITQKTTGPLQDFPS